MHRQLWVCPDCPKKRNQQFKIMDDFKRHLRREHSILYSERDIDVAAKYASFAQAEDRKECFLCSAVLTPKDLASHVAHHFHFWALLAFHVIETDETEPQSRVGAEKVSRSPSENAKSRSQAAIYKKELSDVPIPIGLDTSKCTELSYLCRS